jgi:hypothetical protein
MQDRFLHKNGEKKDNIIIGKFKSLIVEEPVIVDKVTKIKSKWLRRFLSWLFDITIVFLKWLWSHPKRLIKYILTAIGLWLLSFLPFKLPNLPFLPIPVQQSKPQENKKEDKKQEEKKKEETKPVDQTKTNIVTTTVTNTINQTNIVTKTNTVTETKYITNFVVQPIVVTNTVFKEVPVTVTNVLIIKNNVTDTNNNKTAPMNGPAFFFTDDFNSLLQNQQQNPIRGKTVN